jgi:3-isopropylmalate dehydratase small subunit
MGKYEDLRLGEDALPTMTGRAWRIADQVPPWVSEEQILLPPHELGRMLLARLVPQLASRVAPGDFLIAGRSFGSDVRHRAVPVALRALPLGAVVAQSFGIGFLRHALRCGLPALVVEEAPAIQPADRLRVDVEAHVIANLSSGDRYVIRNIDDADLLLLRATSGRRRPDKRAEGW